MAVRPPVTRFTVFTLNSCPHCTDLKGQLRVLPDHIQASFAVVEDDKAAMQELGIEQVPNIVDNESGEVLGPDAAFGIVQNAAAMAAQQAQKSRPSTPPSARAPLTAAGVVRHLRRNPLHVALVGAAVFAAWRWWQGRQGTGLAGIPRLGRPTGTL